MTTREEELEQARIVVENLEILEEWDVPEVSLKTYWEDTSRLAVVVSESRDDGYAVELLFCTPDNGVFDVQFTEDELDDVITMLIDIREARALADEYVEPEVVEEAQTVDTKKTKALSVSTKIVAYYSTGDLYTKFDTTTEAAKFFEHESGAVDLTSIVRNINRAINTGGFAYGMLWKREVI